MRLFIFALTVLITSSPITTALPENSTPEAAEAFQTFTELFGDSENGLPENVSVLGVRIRDGILTVNLSEEFLNYGGNENERAIIDTLKEAAGEIPDVTSLTVLIDGQLKTLTEGRLIDEMPVTDE